ncbi:MAG: hypothetical protein ACK45E_02005, partial [Ignavibacteria bacterium]
MSFVRTWLIVLGCLSLFVVPNATQGSPHVAANLKGFIKNSGQWPTEVLYLARTPAGHVWITRTGVVVDQFSVDRSSGLRHGTVVREVIEDANPAAKRHESAQVTTMTWIKGGAQGYNLTSSVVDEVTITNVIQGADLHYTF